MIIPARPVLIAATVAALFAATGAHAAEKIVLASLGDVSGKVMINQGRGFVAARPGMEVSVGDRVIALEGATAQIVYKDGCVTNLKERNLLPVSARGCATAPVNPNAEIVKLAQAIGAGAPKSDAPPQGKPAPSPPPQSPAPLKAAGIPTAAAIGLGVLALAALGGGGGDGTPISRQ